MSLVRTLRTRLWDAALTGRHVKLRGRRLWWRSLAAWEAASPSTYGRVRTAYLRRRRPDAPATALPSYGSVATVDGIRMRIDERMTPFQVQKLVSGRHTREERGLILPVLTPEDTVMELGGGIGMLAIACALKIGGERVHSYEANPFLEPLIRDNYALNDVAPYLKMCMLGTAAGTRTFHVSEHFSRSSIFKADPAGRPHEVLVEPLNDEIARIRPTVLILDVQGGEEELLGFVDLTGVQTLLVEMHPDLLGVRRVNTLRQRLRAAGFTETRRSGQSFLYARALLRRT